MRIAYYGAGATGGVVGGYIGRAGPQAGSNWQAIQRKSHQ